MEEETNVNTYIVTQKLPKELESRRRIVENLERVTGQPVLGKDDITDIRRKISDLQAEMNELTEKKNVTNDPMEDKLTLFRQQAAIIARKKDGTAERLHDIRNEASLVEEEVAGKRDQVKSVAGETLLKGDDFKRYVTSLRTKSNLYKEKRAELSELKAEYGVLSRTAEVLREREEHLHRQVEALEREKGVTGFRDAQDELEKVAGAKAEIDEAKGKTLEEMSTLVQQLSMKINERKARLAPIIKELRPLRLQCQELQVMKGSISVSHVLASNTNP